MKNIFKFRVKRVAYFANWFHLLNFCAKSRKKFSSELKLDTPAKKTLLSNEASSFQKNGFVL